MKVWCCCCCCCCCFCCCLQESFKYLFFVFLAFEAEQQRKLQEELTAFDKQLEEEAEQEQKKNEKAILALNARKEALLKEKKTKVKQEIEKMGKQGASQEEQDAILKEHSKDLAKLMNKMDADRMRMQSSLEERLKKRRDAKRQAKVLLLNLF